MTEAADRIQKIAVDYFDTETLETVSTEMYIDVYKAVRALDGPACQWHAFRTDRSGA
ncbi:MAG: hypothetical protein LUH00_12885 [Lachnospiraceae bacterium]|nr:hypothetical protein [Lachnospiraceae bacterium]